MTTTTFLPTRIGALADALAELAERLRRGVVTVRGSAGGAAGTIWSPDGLIVTNHHVARGERAEVVTWNDRRFTAAVVARDPAHDLAALRVDAADLPALAPADSDTVRAGQLAFAVGHPWGRRGSVTAGIIFSTGGAAVENQVPLREVIRADLRLAPGNSGGPLADARGRVIGINAMVAGGMAVAVPSNTVARFLAGDLPGQGFLGIRAVPVPVSPEPARAAGLPAASGLLLTAVVEGSPAARAGLLPGDVVLSIDGARGDELPARRARLQPGRPLRLALLRGGRRTEVEAVPAARM
jgi:serine protease Do